MNRLKQFLAKKKVDTNFKSAGVGRRLTEDNSIRPSVRAGTHQRQCSPSSSRQEAVSVERIMSADVAAQAAYKRMNLGAKQETNAQSAIRMKALREIQGEKLVENESHRVSEAFSSASATTKCEILELKHSNAIDNVYFTCELLGGDEKMTKSELKDCIEAFLRSQLDCDGVVASSLMLFSLNSSSKREVASETLRKYIRNLIENPDECRFRRIRVNNKVFQERVLAVKGGREFLEACGFEAREESMREGDPVEQFLVINESKAADIPTLIQALEILDTNQAVPIKLHRNQKIYRLDPNQALTSPKLPHDFFDITVAEVKKEQAEKTIEVERLQSLRTREMKKREEHLRHVRYKYTLIRIRFPNYLLLEGTFASNEPFSAVKDFIREYLAYIEPCLFVLRDPISGTQVIEENKTLNDLNFVPATVLHFDWDADLHAQLFNQRIEIPYVHERYMSQVEHFAVE